MADTTKKVLTEKEKLLLEIQTILKNNDGLESNIPINHIYWELRNQLRSLK